MDTPDIITRYFPTLSDRQRQQFAALGALYADWNAKINVISRKDIDNLYCHHLLHSLAIGKFATPVAGSRVMDLGSGGGFPGIPLAILWPEVQLHLVDRIGKKIRVASEIARATGLDNVSVQHGDAGECHERFDFVVSRAVMPLEGLIKIARRNILPRGRNKWANGLICLKGGELDAEITDVKMPVLEVPLTDYFTEPYFETKKLVYCKL